MKFKRIFSGGLAITMLVALVLPVLSYGGAPGIPGGGVSSGHVSGGTRENYRGYSIGITSPMSDIPELKSPLSTNANYGDLSDNDTERFLAISVDEYYKANYPVAETSMNFVYANGEVAKPPKTYFNGSARSGQSWYQLSGWETSYSGSPQADNVLGGLCMSEAFKGSYVWDYGWYWWLQQQMSSSWCNQQWARNTIAKLLQTGTKAPDNINRFIGEAFAPSDKKDRAYATISSGKADLGGFTWWTTGYENNNSITSQDVRWSAYLGFLMTIYLAGNDEERAVWGPLIDNYCRSIETTIDEYGNETEEWEPTPTLVVINSLMVVNYADPYWLNVPEFYGLYDNASPHAMYYSGVPYSTMGNSAGWCGNATKTLINYFHKNYASGSHHPTIAKLTTVPFKDIFNGSWNNSGKGWGYLQSCKVSTHLPNDEAQWGASVFYAPHITKHDRGAASGTNNLTVTPQTAQVPVNQATPVEELLNYAPALSNDITDTVVQHCGAIYIKNFLYRDGELVDPNDYKLSASSPSKGYDITKSAASISLADKSKEGLLFVLNNSYKKLLLKYTESVLLPALNSTEQHTYQVKTCLVFEGDYPANQFPYKPDLTEFSGLLNSTQDDSHYVVPMVSNVETVTYSTQAIENVYGTFSIHVDPKNRYTIVGTVETNKIEIPIVQTNENLDKIKTFLSQNPDQIQMRVKLSRWIHNDASGTITPVYAGNAQPDPAVGHPSLTLWQDNNDTADYNFNSISYSGVIGLMQGDYAPLTYLEPIEIETLPVQYDYAANVMFRIPNPKDPSKYLTMNLVCTDSDYASYLKKGEDNDNQPVYFSTTLTQNYAELKHNKPHGEEWEAMAGIPTTKNLYFTVGGDEFVVEAVFEKKKTGSVSRTFTAKATYESEPDAEGNTSTITVSNSTTQTIPSSDYIAITSARVYQLTKGGISGLGSLTGTDKVTAEIKSAVAPSIFANINRENKFSTGRYYTDYEPGKDSEEYNLGSESSAETAKSAVNNKIKSIENELQKSTVVLLSDFIVLRTSDGDQPIFYDQFITKAPNATEYATRTASTYDLLYGGYQSSLYWQMHGNYMQSASGLDPFRVYTTRGGYNGNYSNINDKFKSRYGTNTSDADLSEGKIMYGNADDPITMYAALSEQWSKNKSIYTSCSLYTGSPKLGKPSSETLIYADNIDIINTAPNQLWDKFKGEAFYELKLDIGNTTSSIQPKSDLKPTSNSRYGAKGITRPTVYYDNGPSVNGIVTHDPVSTEYAMVEELENSTHRDQRIFETASSFTRSPFISETCPGVASLCPFAYLNCKYQGEKVHSLSCFQDVVYKSSPITKTVTKDTVSIPGEEIDVYYYSISKSTKFDSHILKSTRVGEFTSESIIAAMNTLEPEKATDGNYYPMVYYYNGSYRAYYISTADEKQIKNFISSFAKFYLNKLDSTYIYVGYLKDSPGSRSFTMHLRENVDANTCGEIYQMTADDYIPIKMQKWLTSQDKEYSYSGEYQMADHFYGFSDGGLSYKIVDKDNNLSNRIKRNVLLSYYTYYNVSTSRPICLTPWYSSTSSNPEYTMYASIKDGAPGIISKDDYQSGKFPKVVLMSPEDIPALRNNNHVVTYYEDAGWDLYSESDFTKNRTTKVTPEEWRESPVIRNVTTYMVNDVEYCKPCVVATSSYTTKVYAVAIKYNEEAVRNFFSYVISDYSNKTNVELRIGFLDNEVNDDQRIWNSLDSEGFFDYDYPKVLSVRGNSYNMLVGGKDYTYGNVESTSTTETIPGKEFHYSKLTCTEPHHATPTNWGWFTAGLETNDTTSSEVCKGFNDPRWNNSGFGVYLNSSTLLTKNSTGVVLAKYPNGNYYISKSYTHNDYLNEDYPEGTLVESAKFSGSTLTLGDAGHYSYGNPICYDPCLNDANHKHPETAVTGGKTVKAGTFINLDYKFKVYFPNKGNFKGDNTFGLKECIAATGPSYTNGMDTTEWTKAKYVTFQFNVIYDGTLYPAGTKISLPVNQDEFEFYCVLANDEWNGSAVKFYVEAINNRGLEPAQTKASNYDRRSSNFSAYTTANSTQFIDVVGRIGNLTVTATDDLRYKPLFKCLDYDNWLIPNVMHDVVNSEQNRIVSETEDIRGVNVLNATNNLNKSAGVNTYSKEGTYKSRDYYFYNNQYTKHFDFPVRPYTDGTGNLTAKEPLRLGYPLYMDVSTIGNYYGENPDDIEGGQYRLDIEPKYVAYNYKTGKSVPVNVYMNTTDGYKPINAYYDTVDKSTLYPNPIIMDWESEKDMRMFKTAEGNVLDTIVEAYATPVFNKTDANGETDLASADPMHFAGPSGEVCEGSNSLLSLRNRSRIFNGSSLTYGWDKNPGDVLDEKQYQRQGQKWYFTLGLPSSAKFVRANAGETSCVVFSSDASTEFTSDNYILLCYAKIKAVGNVWTLQHNTTGVQSFTMFDPNGDPITVDPDPSSLPPGVELITVMSIDKSKADDLSVKGTH